MKRETFILDKPIIVPRGFMSHARFGPLHHDALYTLASDRGSVARRVGYWFIAKYRRIAGETSYLRTAARLRKDGVPLDVALMILLGTEERFEHLHKGGV